MYYKTLAVAVGTLGVAVGFVIMFADCNDSLLFKRPYKSEEWLKATEAKLKATDSTLSL